MEVVISCFYDVCRVGRLLGQYPGFPKDGKWNVRWEGLHPMP